jgi:hypothetical protein
MFLFIWACTLYIYLAPDVMVMPALLPTFIQGRIWSKKTTLYLQLTQLEMKSLGV